MSLTRKIAQLLVCGILMMLSSCFSVKYTTNGASIPEGCETFSVDFFENRASYVEPTLSNNFTEALRDRFRSQTNLEEVLDGNGHLHFSGEIKQDFLRPVDITREEYAAATRLTITIRVKYVNTIDDEYDFDSQFSAFRDMGETQDRSEVGTELIEEIIEQIVSDVFNKAVVNW